MPSTLNHIHCHCCLTSLVNIATDNFGCQFFARSWSLWLNCKSLEQIQQSIQGSVLCWGYEIIVLLMCNVICCL